MKTTRIKKKIRRLRIHSVNLRKWFPPNDAFATTVARLCILREDLFLEIHGIVKNPIRALDQNTPAWRHNYFFRNSVRTLFEIRSCIQALKSHREFKEALGRERKEARDFFERFCSDIEGAHSLIRDVRNTVAAHVNHTAVQKALRLMNFDRRGVLQRGEKFLDTHFQFVSELFVAILQAGDPDDDLPGRDVAEVLKISGTMAKLTAAIPIIDLVLQIYIRHRRLM